MKSFLSFPILLTFQEKSRALQKRKERKEMSENINDTRSIIYKLIQRNTSIIEIVFILCMIKQLRVPTFFLTLSHANLKQKELQYLTSKLNNDLMRS